jgi:hypothetical protein
MSFVIAHTAGRKQLFLQQFVTGFGYYVLKQAVGSAKQIFLPHRLIHDLF